MSLSSVDKSLLYKLHKYLNKVCNTVTTKMTTDFEYSMEMVRIETRSQVPSVSGRGLVAADYMDVSFVDYIYEHSEYVLRCDFKSLIDESTVTLYITLFDDKQLQSYVESMNEIMQYVLYAHSICKSSAPSQCGRNLSIYFYPTPLKKSYPSSHTQPITSLNVNSAYTTSCHADVSITIYREEEWKKVLVHEMFHCLGLDFSREFTEALRDKIRVKFSGFMKGVDSEYLMFESYCEIWGYLLSTYIEGYMTSTPPAPYSPADFSRDIYGVRRLFIGRNMDLLSRYFESYTSRSLIAKSSGYVETTNVLSYVLYTGVLLYYLTEFLSFCNANNKKVLRFNGTPTNIMTYSNMIYTLLRRKRWIMTFSSEN